MDQTQRLRLVYRQLKDIQIQADKIVREGSDMESLEEFKKYSCELKRFILEHYPDKEVVKTALEIPEELYNLTAMDIGLMGGAAIFIPALNSYLKQRRIKEQSIETVNIIRSKYGTLEFLIKSIY